MVALLGAAVEAEAVLEARAAAALDRDAQHRDVVSSAIRSRIFSAAAGVSETMLLGALLDLHLRRIVATCLAVTRIARRFGGPTL